jgi:hypothetical protein
MKSKLWILAAVASLASGCGSAVGVGDSPAVDGLASTQIQTSSLSAVNSAVIAVFKEQGFSPISQSERSVTFSKRGGRSADIMWTTINNPNPVMIHPTVSWRLDGSGKVWVGCRVEVAQKSTAFGETTRQPMLVGKSAYHELLQKVKQQVERGR